METKLYKLLQLIEFNEKAEAEAREYYYELIELMEETIYQKDIAIIEEIISDEIDHSIKLMRLAEKYSQVNPNEYEKILDLKKLKGE